LIPLTHTLAEIGERGLLRHIRSRLPAGEGVSVGPGDDAAALQLGPLALVTTDSLVEGVHFTRDTAPARLVGRKALTVNLSDIGAMGGIGRFATVSLLLPPEITLGWVDALYDGLLERAAEVGVTIVGGNLARSSRDVVVDVTLLGEAGRLLLRSGALPGDEVVVSGTLGAAAEGVRLLREGARLDEDGQLVAIGVWTESSSAAVAACLRAQLDPRPPFAVARSIAERGLAHAGMDLSDGLSTDLSDICEMSGVAAVVERALLPVDPKAAGLARAGGGDPFELALHGGEDYQLLLAIAPEALDEARELARVFGAELTAVGRFVEGAPEVRLRDHAGERPLVASGHDHFRPLASS
jgi:thiamine-monophosphate kinase